MADDKKESIGGLSLLLGGIVLIAFIIFLSTGGELGGTKKVESDADLPQVTSPTSPPSGPLRSENTGSR
ncbi:MAG: hypothetical protein J0H17_21435 [Rhizobiales bacterium]|nr:hypothetical protein [Hyphomicrobiales bacterium]